MEPNERKQLRFISWNVHGLENKTDPKPKFDYISEELRRQRAEVVFLQETRIGHENYTTLSGIKGWERHFTVYDSKSKGVAILIKDEVPFQYWCHDEDYSGGYLVLFCHLHGQLFTLVNVYNHKEDQDMLNRLKDYLKETAEGVLVVGGDFNTVLDLSFDRISTGKVLRHTPQCDIFNEFTASLNLMDTWAHCNPTAKEFTYSQKDSSSRLDMFLMPENIIDQAQNVTIESSANERCISDHKLLVLSLTLSEQARNDNAKVAYWLNKHEFSRDGRTGQINGAEILSVIKSLTDSGQRYCDGKRLQTYKTNCCPKTETLKLSFNDVLKSKKIPKHFKEHTTTKKLGKQFNAEYVIFTMILAKRLETLLKAFPEKKSKPNTGDCYSVTFRERPKQIRWTFLKKCLSDLCKTSRSKKKIHPRDFNVLEDSAHGGLGLTEDSSILESILPKISNPSDDFSDDPSDDLRELQEGCPLTKAILSLVLKYLEICINEKGYTTNVSHYRQAIVIRRKYVETSSGNNKLLELAKKN